MTSAGSAVAARRLCGRGALLVIPDAVVDRPGRPCVACRRLGAVNPGKAGGSRDAILSAAYTNGI